MSLRRPSECSPGALHRVRRPPIDQHVAFCASCGKSSRASGRVSLADVLLRQLANPLLIMNNRAPAAAPAVVRPDPTAADQPDAAGAEHSDQDFVHPMSIEDVRRTAGRGRCCPRT